MCTSLWMDLCFHCCGEFHFILWWIQWWIHCCSATKSRPTLCNPMNCNTPGFPVLHYLSPRICSNSCPLSQWCHPTNSSFVAPLSSCPQSLTSSGSFWMSQLFTSGGQSIGAGVSASSISPSSEYLGLISFSIDFDLLAFQIILKSLLHHHNSNASVLWSSAFFMVQLSHPYMSTGKTIALTRWAFVGKVMSGLFNMLSRFVIAFLSRSKPLLISWLQSPSTVILEPKKIKSVSVSTIPPIYLPWNDGTGCRDLSFLNVEF